MKKKNEQGLLQVACSYEKNVPMGNLYWVKGKRHWPWANNSNFQENIRYAAIFFYVNCQQLSCICQRHIYFILSCEIMENISVIKVVSIYSEMIWYHFAVD